MSTSQSPRPHHLNVAVDEGAVEQTASFYQDMLGLSPVELPRDEAAYGASIQTLEDQWGYQYHFIPNDPGFAERSNLPVNPIASGHLAFRVEDVAAVRSRLEAAGIPYSDMGVWAIKGWHQLFCADPSGRVIEFHQVIEDGTPE